MNDQPTPQDLIARLNAEHANTEAAAAAAVDVYKAAKTFAAAYDEPQTKAKALINDIMLETGNYTINTPAGKAMVTAPSVRVAYDAKALDALCASSPDIARILEPHRKETMIAGSLTIR